MTRLEPMPLEEFRRRMGAAAAERTDAELLRWRASLDWFAELALRATSAASGEGSKIAS